MSLILDALRKSEAERRRGQAPDLFASLPPPAAPRDPGLLRLWPGLAIVALALVAGILLWPDHGQATREVTGTAPAEDAASAPGPRRPGGPGPERRPAPAAPVPPVAAPAPALPAVATATRPNAAAPTSAAPLARPANAGQLQASPAPMAMPPAPAPAQIAVAAAFTPSAPAEAGDGESLPPIAVLEASARAALPPLKLSMHVWNDEPGKRFAIIDGRRVTDGSTAGGSTVEAIRRDGVVLNIDGRRFLLPRP